MARLDTICSINMGASPDSSTYNESREGLPFYQGNADFGEKHPTPRIWCKVPVKVARKGDVLISVRAPIGALNIAAEQCCIGRGLAALTVNETICDTGYLWYGIISKIDELNAKGTGSTFKAISRKILEETDIPLPDLPTQRRIAATLDKVSEGIDLCRKMLGDLDELVKSQFVEMFGDVLKNTKGFETCLFGDYVVQMNIGPFGSDLKNDCFVSREDGYCMVYEQKHAIDKDMTVEPRFVTEAKYQQMKRFDIGPGDIIVSCRGTIGKCFMLPEDAPHGIIHPSLMMIKPKNTVNHAFLVCLLENILKEQQENGSGVKMAIKATELARISCIKPSQQLQDEYIAFMFQADKSKYAVQQQLAELETLKKSLMQKYFG